MSIKSILAIAALASSVFLLAGEAMAASGAYTQLPQTEQQSKIREKIYGISGTADVQLPPLVVPVNASVEMLARTGTSSSVIVTPTAVFMSTTVPNNPSGSLAGIAALRGTNTVGGYGKVVDKATFPKVGGTVDVSDTGALWEVWVKVREGLK